jgi:DNA-binding MarR family transcriptional regulator
MSADIQSALIDAALWLYHAFFAPGDQLLWKFPALDVPGHSRVVSGLLSAVVWLGAILLIIYVLRLLRDLDRALTAFVVRLYEELQRAGRVVVRRVTIAFRSFALERQARLARTEVSELPALSPLQLHILQCHASLPPAHLLTPSDIASALRMRSADVEKVLGTLRKLSLVERTLGAGDGEDGYRLTRAGQVFLAACGGRQRRIEPTLGSA